MATFKSLLSAILLLLAAQILLDRLEAVAPQSAPSEDVGAASLRPQLILQLRHNAGVRTVEISSDGRTFASGGLDNLVRLWDAQTGMSSRTLATHLTQGVWTVAFSPDGKQLATGGQQGDVEIWSVDTGRLLRSLPSKGHYVYSDC